MTYTNTEEALIITRCLVLDINEADFRRKLDTIHEAIQVFISKQDAQGKRLKKVIKPFSSLQYVSYMMKIAENDRLYNSILAESGVKEYRACQVA